MLLSLRWLRELCPFPHDAAAVAVALTARGLTVDAVRDGSDDSVLDVDVPANRPDCLGHRGVARELAAAFGVPLAAPPAPPAPAGDPVERAVRVEIVAPDLCGRYTARLVRNVRVGPSPAWVVDRLAACGLHAINNVVDASNLVLLELGHPIHTFDFSGLAAGTIRIRRAIAGERLVTLDGIDRALDPEMLVIADERRAVAVAGVIGGRDSQIGPATQDVLVEAAWFVPSSVRSTARRLGAGTDASHRFERGVDPEGVTAAQDRAACLLADLAGGIVAPGTVDVRGTGTTRAPILLRPARAAALLGFAPSESEIRGALEALALPFAPSATDGSFLVHVPSWRVDLEREADLVEEVARHLGYDRIPATLPATGEPPRAPDDRHEAEERSRDLLSHLGFQEAFCYSMVAPGDDEPFVDPDTPPPLPLDNPIAETMGALRRSLLPGLVRAVDLNLRRGTRDVRLFEAGRVFLPRAPGELPREPMRVGIAWCGAARPRHWSAPVTAVSLAELAGAVEHLTASLRPGATLERGAPDPSRSCAALRPGGAVEWRAESVEDGPVAWGGALHPDLAARLDLAAEVFVAEIDLDRLCRAPRRPRDFETVARIPSVTRDLSLVLPRSLPYAAVARTLAAVAAPGRAEWEVTDRYEGPPLGPDEIALTVRVILQPLERTLTDAETESYRSAVVEALRRGLGVRLRETPAGD